MALEVAVCLDVPLEGGCTCPPGRAGKDVEELPWLEAADAAYRSLPEWEALTTVDAAVSPEELLATVRNVARCAAGEAQ